MPHWQNVQVYGDGEPESTIIKSQDSHTFTIRCPNKHESRNEGAHYSDGQLLSRFA